MTGKGGAGHATAELLERYAAGDTGVQPDVLWALEAHLEGCADCRAGLVVDAGTAACWTGSGPTWNPGWPSSRRAGGGWRGRCGGASRRCCAGWR